jgi:hypothetical protein
MPFLCWIVGIGFCIGAIYSFIFYPKEIIQNIIWTFIWFGTFAFLIFKIQPPKTQSSKLVWTLVWVVSLIFICTRPMPRTFIGGISGTAVKNYLIFTIAVAGLVLTLKEK